MTDELQSIVEKYNRVLATRDLAVGVEKEVISVLIQRCHNLLEENAALQKQLSNIPKEV